MTSIIGSSYKVQGQGPAWLDFCEGIFLDLWIGVFSLWPWLAGERQRKREKGRDRKRRRSSLSGHSLKDTNLSLFILITLAKILSPNAVVLWAGAFTPERGELQYSS